MTTIEQDTSGSNGLPNNEDRMAAMWAHLGAGIADLLCFTVCLAWIVPLIIYLTKKDTSKFVAFHAAQSLILQLVVLGANLILFLGSMVGLFCGTIPLALLINVGAFVYALLIALKAKDGEWAEYVVIGDFARRFAGVDEPVNSQDTP